MTAPAPSASEAVTPAPTPEADAREIERLRAEVERLATALQFAKDGWREAEARAASAEAERDEQLALGRQAGERCLLAQRALADMTAERDALKARLAVMDAALEPFADFADFLDSETEGVSDTDEVRLFFEESDFLLERIYISAFRRARDARKEVGNG